ncbi:MAG: hypothetical protein GF311_00590 [Candidatus Lokiarchaeota archaeon]|nr:hypothetical protein [Candidatus Lokiarchaeota archaeon]
MRSNCYAYLSLDILNKTNMIDSNQFKSFIWSCYNPQEGAFIGHPYKTELEEEFKISTLDNTYFAVEVLNKLIQN